MRTKRIALAAVIAIVTVGAGAAAVAANVGDDDDDTPITGVELEHASAAALAHTGQGRVTGTEIGDEDSYYEIEVTLDDGSQVDVQLDTSFHVVATETDTEEDLGNGDD